MKAKYKYKPKMYAGGGNLSTEQKVAGINLAGQGLNAIGGAQDTNMQYGTNQYFDNRNKSLGKGQTVANAAGAIPIVGAFKAVGEGLQNSIAKKDAYGVSDNSNAAIVAGGFANPLESTTSAFSDIKKGNFSGQTAANLLLPGVGQLMMNKEKKKERDKLQQEQAAQQAEQERLRLEQEAKIKQTQQDNYNTSYYAANTELTNPTGSIYANGGVIGYGDGNTPTTKENRKTPQQWDAENKALGYKQAGYGRKYKEYYNPKEYTLDSNGAFIKIADQGKTVNYNNDPTYNPYIRYEEPEANMEIARARKEIPKVLDPMKQVGYNGMLAPIVEQYAKGGLLSPIASNTVKAEGDTHEEGGISLQKNGRVYAEVEDQEIIDGNNVYSDRLKLGNKTYASIAENLGKQKGKYEKLAKSNNYRDKNTVERGVNNVQRKLDNLFEIQENSKPPVNNAPILADGGYIDPIKNRLEDMEEVEPTFTGKPMKTKTPSSSNNSFDWNKVASNAQYVVPFIDNIYNASLINKTPEIAKYSPRVAYDNVATAMRTKFNVDNQVNNVDNTYNSFVKNVDENSSSSNVSRGNKLGAFAAALSNKNNIYANKENAENQLINANNQNIQNVTNQNLNNRQNIDNQNLALLDNYNMQKVMREDNILKNKSSNVSNAVDDAGRMIQDYNMKSTDQERVMVDALRYPNGAGTARLVGSDTMNSLVKNPSYYKQIESSLKNQPSKLQEFYKLYGKK